MMKFRLLPATLSMAALTTVFLSPFPAEAEFLPTGAKPAFNRAGEMVALVADEQGQTAYIGFDSGREAGSLISGPWSRESAFHRLRLDRKRALWAVWTERSPQGNSISWAPMDRESSANVRSLVRESGDAEMPDLAFDAADRPWLVWVDRSPAHLTVKVADAEEGTAWSIYSAIRGEITPPQILADGQGGIWAFWTAVDPAGGQESLFGRRRAAGRWLAIQKIAASPNSPCTAFDAAASEDGRIWCAWSGFEEGHYKIFVKHWDGRRWAPPSTVSPNGGYNDLLPSLAFLDGTQPIIVWQRWGGDGAKVLAATRDASGWSHSFIVSASCDPYPSPQVTASAGRIGLVWQERGRLRPWTGTSAVWPPGQPDSTPVFPSLRNLLPPSETPPLLFNASLKENLYTAFGDSITSGQIGSLDAPEKGYVPRLQTLLTQAFGSTTVYNEGWGGEFTAQGLVRIDAVLAAHPARFLLLLEGTNDTKILNISMTTAAFNLREMVRKCLAAGVFPAIATLLPRFDALYYFPEYINRFNEFNAGIRQIAVDLQIPLVDMNKSFLEYPVSSGGVDALLSSDSKHPSELGYQFMAENWRDAIRRYPFPPASVEIRREQDKLLFTRVPGVLLTWTASSKPADPTVIAGYRIYRRKSGQGTNDFRRIAEIQSPLSYFDTDILAGENYEYTIAAYRPDGIQGPCSPLAKTQ